MTGTKPTVSSNSCAECSSAVRIMARAVSWLQIKEAAFATHKGPAIIEEMQRFIAGNKPPADETSEQRLCDAVTAGGSKKFEFPQASETGEARDWRGILDLPRVRIIGTGGMSSEKKYAYIALEMWTEHEAATQQDTRDTLERFFAKAALAPAQKASEQSLGSFVSESQRRVAALANAYIPPDDQPAESEGVV